MPLAWLLGRWEGSGKGTYPGTEDFDFGQQIDFAQNGSPYLHYLSQTFETDDEGLAVRPLSMETGFWRPRPEGALEVVLSHPDGFAEVWYGTITGAGSSWPPTQSSAPPRPRTTRPGSGFTAASRATCCGPWTRPPAATRCRTTCGRGCVESELRRPLAPDGPRGRAAPPAAMRHPSVTSNPRAPAPADNWSRKTLTPYDRDPGRVRRRRGGALAFRRPDARAASARRWRRSDRPLAPRSCHRHRARPARLAALVDHPAPDCA